MHFVANFIRFQQCKNFDNLARFNKVTESLKVKAFFEIQRILSIWGESPLNRFKPKFALG